ncbi:MAG: cysteine-rich small domain-containing protein [Clostridia bacterium]
MNNCKYFKCHDIDENIFDCSLCYCPFYKICKDSNNYKLFNGYLLNNGVLACEKCTYFHIKSNVNKYNELKNNGLNNEEIFKYFVNKLCN